MKVIARIAFGLVVSVVTYNDIQGGTAIPTLTVENIKAALESCAESKSVEILLKNAAKHDAPELDNENGLKDSLVCYYDLLGILVDNDINKEKLKEYFLVGKRYDPYTGIPVSFEDPAEKSAVIAQVNEMVEKCGQPKSDIPREAVLELFKCDEGKKALNAQVE